MSAKRSNYLKEKTLRLPAVAVGGTAVLGSDIISILPGISIILLVVALYFVSSAIKLYGGKIGHSLNVIGLGIFVIAVKELFLLSSMVDSGTAINNLSENVRFVQTFNNISNILVFALLSYGFYSMTTVFKTNDKKSE